MNQPPRQPELERPELEHIVQAVVEEVLCYLAPPSAPLPPATSPSDPAPDANQRAASTPSADDAPCQNCDGSCVTTCEDKTRRVLAAGAQRISARPNRGEPAPGLAGLIDHTCLKPTASDNDIETLCREAVRYGFATVCVNPWYVPLAVSLTRDSPVKVCTVVGFPLGATFTSVKTREAEQAILLGAREIDMVINIGALKSRRDVQVEADIAAVVDVCRQGGAICKVIIETALLSTEDKVRASLAAKRAGADFVKTSTGFAAGGATAEDVALIRALVGPDLGIKASGGIHTLDDLQKMLAAGATRIGASASVRIVSASNAAQSPTL